MQFEEKKKHISLQETPLVSIITPLYNAAPFILETITSICKQSYSHWEHIIIDDCSTDTSVAIVSKAAKNEPRIKMSVNAKNQGAAYCRNKATQIASGSYIAFLDADDTWHPDKLRLQIHFMQTHQCDVSFTSYIHMDANGTSLQKRVKALSKLSFKKQRLNNYIGNLTGIYCCATLGKIQAPNIRKRQDWAVWLEAIKKSGKPALGIQKDLAFYRVHGASMSANKAALIQYNYAFYQHYLGYSKAKSAWFLLCFFWEYFIHRPKQIEQITA